MFYDGLGAEPQGDIKGGTLCDSSRRTPNKTGEKFKKGVVMGRVVLGLMVLGISTIAQAGTVWMVADNNMPDPNQEVTVYVHTDTPLFILDFWAQAVGDINFTAAMSNADCNQYGWDPGWQMDSYFDEDGWVSIGGVAWPSEANGVIGYFKFIYYGGQVSISIEDEWGDAFAATFESVTFSADPLGNRHTRPKREHDAANEHPATSNKQPI